MGVGVVGVVGVVGPAAYGGPQPIPDLLLSVGQGGAARTEAGHPAVAMGRLGGHGIGH